MKALGTRKFYFSASFNRGHRVIGHNYVLGVITNILNESEEYDLEHTVQRVLIQKVHSRDLGQHVDFLKGREITELSLLKAFWKILEPQIRPAVLHSLYLEKDSHSQVSISRDR